MHLHYHEYKNLVRPRVQVPRVSNTILKVCAPLWIFSSVQLLSLIWLFVTPGLQHKKASLSITNSQSLLQLMSTEFVMPSNQLILCYPLLLLSSIFPSISIFSNESVLRIRWPKYWSFSFSISPFNEHSGLISFRMDWLDLLAVQGTLKSVLQHHSSKASILHCSALWPNSHIHKWLLDKPKLWLYRPLSVMSCLCFLICCHSFSFKKHASFNFMAAVTICNDFGAQENKVWTLNSFINSFIYHSSWLFFIFFFSSWLLIMSLQYHFHKIDF